MAGRHHRPSRLRPRRTPLLLAGAALLVVVTATAVAWPEPGIGLPDHTVTAAFGTAPRADRADRAEAAEQLNRGGAAPQPSPATRTAATGTAATGPCEASFYGEPQPTASGEVLDPEAMTAAHRTVAFGTRLRVTNPATGRSVVVRINDRGPFVEGRCLDLSQGAFLAIASLEQGVVPVTYEVLSD